MSNQSVEMSVQELAKLPFLRGVPMDGRVIAATSYYCDKKPFFGMPNPQSGEMILMPNTTPTCGAYWSVEEIDSDQDTYFPILDTLAQYFTFPRLLHPMRAIEVDLNNLASIIEKFVAIYEYSESRPQSDTAVRLMYLTELEYLFGVCRSLIDLLHDCYRHLHGYAGGTALPETFGRFVDKEVADLAKKYSLPPVTEAYLLKVKPLFGHVRKVRDSIFHQGKSLELIFITDAGPGLCMDYSPFDVFKTQLESDGDFVSQMQPNRIGSLFYLVVKLVDQMIEATNDLATTLTAVFCPLPPRYTKDQYRYILRGPSFLLLNQRKELLRRCWLASARQFVAPRLNARTHPLGRRTSPGSEQAIPENCSVVAKSAVATSDQQACERERWVAENAYLRWLNEQRGRDRACQHWYDAEREFLCESVLNGRPLNAGSSQDLQD
jgi:hypothetical protein